MTERKQSSPFSTILLALLALALLAFACLVVIGSFFMSSSTAGTLQSGRKVVTETDSLFLSSTFSGDTAKITSGKQQIIVKPDSLIVNGVTVATIDPSVSELRVSIESGEVEFIADGEPVQLNR